MIFLDDFDDPGCCQIIGHYAIPDRVWAFSRDEKSSGKIGPRFRNAPGFSLKVLGGLHSLLEILRVTTPNYGGGGGEEISPLKSFWYARALPPIGTLAPMYVRAHLQTPCGWDSYELLFSWQHRHELGQVEQTTSHACLSLLPFQIQREQQLGTNSPPPGRSSPPFPEISNQRDSIQARLKQNESAQVWKQTLRWLCVASDVCVWSVSPIANCWFIKLHSWSCSPKQRAWKLNAVDLWLHTLRRTWERSAHRICGSKPILEDKTLNPHYGRREKSFGPEEAGLTHLGRSKVHALQKSSASQMEGFPQNSEKSPKSSADTCMGAYTLKIRLWKRLELSFSLSTCDCLLLQ